ncbi:MAG: thermonuclease family protein [Hyphomicrobiales bacterium]|uniref:thermonuclease n=1 Tax=Shimia thalassica TaxID=1715693 RepID=UPI0032999873
MLYDQEMGGILIMACASLMAIDGDTARCCAQTTGPCEGQNIRPMGAGAPDVLGFDTPEIYGRSQCAREAELGLQAGARFAELLRTPGLVIHDSGVINSNDRPLVWLRLPNGTTVGEIMIREDYAREWKPGQSNDWCSPSGLGL